MANKCEKLIQLLLWECPGCQRLEFTPQGRVANGCIDCSSLMERIISPGSMEVFEAIAQHFARDTGYLRPGKSAAPGDHKNSDLDAREAAWQEWNRKPLDITERKSVKPPKGQIA